MLIYSFIANYYSVGKNYCLTEILFFVLKVFGMATSFGTVLALA